MAGGVRFDNARPTGYKWLPVATIPDIGFLAAQVAAGFMAVIIPIKISGTRTVVTGDDDQSVFDPSMPFQRSINFSDHQIDQHNHISTQTGLAPAANEIRGNARTMRS